MAGRMPSTLPQNNIHVHVVQLPDLPDAAVLAILRCMPLQQRLRCALVCRSWAAAAALIPAAVETSFFRGPSDKPTARHLQRYVAQSEAAQAAKSMQCLQSLLDSNSARVISLNLNMKCPTQWMCWADIASGQRSVRLGGQTMLQLTSLKLQGATLEVDPPERSSGGAPSFPALLELQLSSCTVPLSEIKLLHQVTTLTRLSLRNNTFARPRSSAAGEAGPADMSAAISDLAKRNPSLVELILGDNLAEVEAEVEWNDNEGGYTTSRDLEPLEHPLLSDALSSLQQLQHLDLPIPAFSRSNLAALPASLTALYMAGSYYDRLNASDGAVLAGLSLQAVPSLTRLTALQELEVDGCTLDPTILLRFPQLKFLTLLNPAEVLVPGPEGTLQYADGPDGSVALLASVGQLTQLQSLHVYVRLHQPDIDAEGLAALTASSQLTQLVLEICGPGCLSASALEALAEQALQHMLPEGKLLPHLKSLVLPATAAGPASGFVSLTGAAAVQRWVQCCPALEYLLLEAVEDAAAVCQALLPLRTSLTSLTLSACSGDSSGDAAAAAAAVVQLTGLQSLVFFSSRSLTLAVVQQLTALQGLTHLTLPAATFQCDSAAVSTCGDKTLCASEESDRPDVWQQLQQLCLESS